MAVRRIKESPVSSDSAYDSILFSENQIVRDRSKNTSRRRINQSQGMFPRLIDLVLLILLSTLLVSGIVAME